MRRDTFDLRAMLPVDGHAYVKIDAELVLDLIEAAGWVGMMYRELDMSEVTDPASTDYLASEADLIREKALLAVEGWVPEVLEVKRVG